MTKKITLTIEFTVEETETKFGSAEELRKCLEAYISSPEAPLFEDYGPETWGGYEGAYITHVHVKESRVGDVK